MTMKIDGNRPGLDTEAAEASKRAAGDRRVQRSGVDRPSGGTRDRVDVSSDAQLMTSAMNAIQRVPSIRTELVEHFRQKLNAGEVGTDSGKLADRLIDDLLNR
jgi:flagellar biosynthesis anti-sigma factor FlgM